MQHSPPATRAHMDRLEERLKEQVKNYRRYLQKIARIKTKVLAALRDEGCVEAAELLQVPARVEGAVRCQKCIGCYTLQHEGPCTSCPQCLDNRGCVEHTRLCFTWRQPSTTYVEGSVVTGVSSVCNVIEYELTKYKELMDKLGEASLEVESVLDDFPSGSHQPQRERYNATRRTRDIHMEEDQLRTIEILLDRYQDERVRLQDVGSDLDSVVNDAVEVHAEPGAPYGLMSQTNTHYQFGTPAPAGLPILDEASGDAIEPDGDALGFGLGFGLESQEIFQTLLQEPISPASTPQEGASQAEDVHRPRSRSTSGPRVSISSEVERRSLPASPPRKEPSRSQPTLRIITPARSPPKPTTTSSTTVTVTSTTTRTTPSTATAQSHARTSAGPHTSARRRSSSEGELDGNRQQARESGQEHVFRTKQLVATRSQILSQDLDILVTRLHEAGDRPAGWVSEELRTCQARLNALEELESTTWTTIARTEGKASQKARIEKWREWLSRQTEKVRKVKAWTWNADASVASRSRDEGSAGCYRSMGHVEKVKLPVCVR